MSASDKKMMRLIKVLSIIFIFIGLTTCTKSDMSNSGWHALFNGKDLSNWRHFLAVPDSSIDVPGLPKDSLGHYTRPLGYMSGDPLEVFSVAQLQGEPVIRISGQVIGNLFTEQTYQNYHLKLQFKWGDKKWSWMKGRPKDGGILYHYGRTSFGKSFRHEFQIHQGDVGSYWARHVCVQIPARFTAELPDAIVQAKPFLSEWVTTLNDTMLLYDDSASLYAFTGTNEWQICIANPMNEKSPGSWNTLELICFQNHALHIVNGRVCMALYNAEIQDGDKKIPIDHGSIQLQSEGAEIFFKDIYIKSLQSVPKTYKAFFAKVE